MTLRWRYDGGSHTRHRPLLGCGGDPCRGVQGLRGLQLEELHLEGAPVCMWPAHWAHHCSRGPPCALMAHGDTNASRPSAPACAGLPLLSDACVGRWLACTWAALTQLALVELPLLSDEAFGAVAEALSAVCAHCLSCTLLQGGEKAQLQSLVLQVPICPREHVRVSSGCGQEVVYGPIGV